MDVVYGLLSYVNRPLPAVTPKYPLPHQHRLHADGSELRAQKIKNNRVGVATGHELHRWGLWRHEIMRIEDTSLAIVTHVCNKIGALVRGRMCRDNCFIRAQRV